MAKVEATGDDELQGVGELSAFGLVFLIEDSPTQAQHISQQLGYFGYEVETFSNTTDALQALTQYTPLVVLTDINLPEGPRAGLQAAPAIKASADEPPVVVAISSLTDFDTRLMATRVGIDRYYVKPVNVPLLVDQLDRLTSGRPETPLKVLVIDDRRAAAQLYAAALRAEQIEAKVLTEPRKVLEVIEEFQPDAILCDVEMPDCSGFELAHVVRQSGANAGIPLVFISDDEEKTAGALDVLTAGGEEMLSATLPREWITTVVRERARRARSMRRQITCDSMTGMLKHSALKEALARTRAIAEREKSSFCYAMVDIDKFKSVNDTYGHAVGDRVIVSLARLLSQNLDAEDLVGRYGGEEFGVILPNVDLAKAEKVMNALRERFARVRHIAEGKPFTATFSCGVAAFPDFRAVDTMIEKADEALYEAKRGGRNRVVTAKA